MTKPLSGVRVLDLTRLLPGNYTAWILASFGADVVKVEDPGAGDYMRDFGIQVDGQGAPAAAICCVVNCMAAVRAPALAESA